MLISKAVPIGDSFSKIPIKKTLHIGLELTVQEPSNKGFVKSGYPCYSFQLDGNSLVFKKILNDSCSKAKKIVPQK